MRTRVALLKPYDEAGAANGLFTTWTFVDDGLFLTRARALGAVLRIGGVDYECLDPSDRDMVIRRWKAALRLWDHRHRIYQYLFKRRHESIPSELPDHPIARQAVEERLHWFETHRDELYRTELYVVVLYEGWATNWPRGWGEMTRRPAATIKSWFATRTTVALLDDEIRQAITDFRRRLDGWQRQVEDSIHPTLLGSDDAYRMLWRLANYGSTEGPPRFRPEIPLDEALAHSDVEAYRDQLRVGKRVARMLTLKQPPGTTWAHQLEPLYQVAGVFVVCTEWCSEPPHTTRRHIHGMRRFWHAATVSIVTYLQTREPQPHEVLVDKSADTLVDVLGDALTIMDVDDQYYGWFALSVMVVADTVPDLDRLSANILKALTEIDATATEETYHGLAAWCAVMPGNSDQQVRSRRLLNSNAADLALLFAQHTGEMRDEYLHREYLAVVQTSHQSPYFLTMRYYDVGHAIALGATGSGKSFLMNFLVTHAMKYQPRVMIFVIGGAYKKLTEFFEGAYLTLGLEPGPVRINPFCLAPNRENLHFLASFVRVLFGPDRQDLTAREERELYDQIANIYSLDPSLRRLATLVDMLPRSLEGRLKRWVRDGPYATVFDHAVDTVTFNPFQTFDLAGLERYPDVLDPLFFYLLHRATLDVYDPARAAQWKLCLIDELWRVLRDPRVRAFVREALKTWRQLRASMWMATQAAEDLVEGDLLRTVIESCPTRLFLANPGLDMGMYRELFHLSETETHLIRDLLPRQQFLLKRPDRAKLLTLSVDPNTTLSDQLNRSGIRRC